MATRPCLTCGKLSPATRCPACTKARNDQRNTRRTWYHHDWERTSRDARRAWIDEHGPICPGYHRPPHPVNEHTLQLDHTTGRVLCNRCNVAAGPAGH